MKVEDERIITSRVLDGSTSHLSGTKFYERSIFLYFEQILIYTLLQENVFFLLKGWITYVDSTNNINVLSYREMMCDMSVLLTAGGGGYFQPPNNIRYYEIRLYSIPSM